MIPLKRKKTFKTINKFIKNSKISFSTIQIVECCTVTTKSEKKKN